MTFLPARVLSVDPTGVNKFIVIDRGSTDGVTVGMAVTDPNYYVGVVVQVDDTSSQVLLAIDSTHTVGVELESSHATGVAYGMWQQGGRMEIRYVDRDVEITARARRWSRPARPISAPRTCRAGLIIGKASGQPSIDNQGDTQTMQVIPAADFDNLSFVTVITSTGQGQ